MMTSPLSSRAEGEGIPYGGFPLLVEEKGVEIIIGLAGAAAHLPGVIASFTTLPVSLFS